MREVNGTEPPGGPTRVPPAVEAALASTSARHFGGEWRVALLDVDTSPVVVLTFGPLDQPAEATAVTTARLWVALADQLRARFPLLDPDPTLQAYRDLLSVHHPKVLAEVERMLAQ